MSSIYQSFLPTYLYIKQHQITGKLYFGKTVKNPEEYKGSGKHWTLHRRKHGNKIDTVWYCLYFDEQSIKEAALSFSKLWNIIESDQWLNLIEEDGICGGDTSKSEAYKQWLPLLSEKNKRKMWWNNGSVQVFSEFPPDDSFTRGRLPFNNTGAQIGANIQKEKIWVNNGQHEQMILRNNIPDGYVKGRLKHNAFSGGVGRGNVKGTKWWTNGKQTKMSSISPGPEWRLGRY